MLVLEQTAPPSTSQTRHVSFQQVKATKSYAIQSIEGSNGAGSLLKVEDYGNSRKLNVYFNGSDFNDPTTGIASSDLAIDLVSYFQLIHIYIYFILVSCKIFVPLIRHTIQYVIAEVMYKLKVKRFFESFGLTI